MVYLSVKEGDEFGTVDIAHNNFTSEIKQPASLISYKRLIRNFSVQALSDCELFKINLNCFN